MKPWMRCAGAVSRVRPAAVAAALVLLATLVCLVALGRKSLDLDEAVSVAYARLGWAEFWTAVSSDANMALYYAILRFWARLGTSEVVVRLMSVIPAVATIPLVYALGARLFGARVGLVAGVFLALNSFYVQYAQDARGYSLALCLTTLSSLLFVRGVERPARLTWIGYAAASILAVYAHFFAALVVAAHGASFIRSRPPGVPWKALLGSALAIGIFVLPLVAFALVGNTGQVSWIPKLTVSGLYPLVYLTGGDAYIDRMGGRLLVLVFLFFGLLGLAHIVKGRRPPVCAPVAWHGDFLLAWLGVPLALSAAVSVTLMPILVVRYLIVILPALVLVAAIGVCQVRAGWRFAAALAAVVVLMARSLVMYYQAFPQENWRDAARYLAAFGRPADALVFYAPYVRRPYDYYHERLAAPAYPEVIASTRLTAAPGRASLAALLAHYNRIWVVLSHDRENGDSTGEAIQARLLMSGFSHVGEQKFSRVTIVLYGKDARSSLR